MSVFGELWSDEDGMIFKNMRFTKESADDLYPAAVALGNAERSESEPRTAATATDDDDDPAGGDEAVYDREAEEIRAVSSPRPPRLIEKYVPAGEVVTVFGVYQEMTGGIGPIHRSGPPTRLFRRNATEQEKVSRRSINSNLLGGIIGFAVIHAFLLAAIWLYQHSDEGKRQKQKRTKQQPAVAAKLSFNSPAA